MGCTNNTTLAGISYSCDDLATGGIKSLYYAWGADVDITLDASDIVTGLTAASGDVVKLEFNNKDGFTAFTDVKSVSADGIVNTVPTIVVEFPRMNAAKRLELNNITKAGTELMVFVETAAGEYHCVGSQFGMYASEANGQSGTGRSTKNIYQLTFVGEENDLAYTMDETAWGLMLDAV